MDEAARPELESSEVLEIINFRQMAKVTGKPSTRCQVYEVLARMEGPTPKQSKVEGSGRQREAPTTLTKLS